MSHGDGIVFSANAFYSDNPSLNPAGYKFSRLYLENVEINVEEAGARPSFF